MLAGTVLLAAAAAAVALLVLRYWYDLLFRCDAVHALVHTV
jgi:hypothetical protein